MPRPGQLIRLAWGLASATLLVFALPASPAWASLPTCNSSTQQTFEIATTNLPQSTYGTTNKILVKNRGVETSCQGVTFSAAMLAKGLPGSVDQYYYLHMGWEKYRDSAGTLHLCEYWEKSAGDPSHPVFGANCDSNTLLSYGSYAKFRIDGSGGTGSWNMQVDYLLGGGFTTRNTFSTTYTTGYAMGFTQKLGGSTAMTEDQRNLQVYTQNAWQAWLGNHCYYSDLSGTWFYEYQTADSYTIAQSPQSICG